MCPFCQKPCKNKWCEYERIRKDRQKTRKD